MLFPARIPIVRSVSDRRPIDVENSSEAAWVVSESGESWVLKLEEHMGVNGLLAEAIAWLLAKHMDLPVPDGAVYQRGSETGWLSATLPNVMHWSAARAHFVDNLEDLGGVLALDAILLNGDRHQGNILLQTQETESHMRAWGIDFANASVGYAQAFGKVGLDDLPHLNVARGLPTELLRPGLLRYAALAEQIDNASLKGFVTEACEIAREQERQPILDGLGLRLTHAQIIADRYMDAVEKTI